MMKQCPVCNNEFKRDKLSQKYCSEECRQERVREYDRQRKQKERAEERVIRDKERKRVLQAKKEAREKAELENNKARQAELMARVKAGDPLARMHIAKPQSIKYWEAYQEYEIEYAESGGKDSKRIVNGISVHEPDFAEKVILTIEELGHVKTELY